MPNSKPIPIIHADDRVGTDYYPCDFDKIAAIVYSDIPDKGRSVQPVDEISQKIADNIIELITKETEAGRLISRALEDYDDHLTLYATYPGRPDYAALVQNYCDSHLREHAAEPELTVTEYPADARNRIVELVFSYPASRQELQDLSDTCRALGIRLFLDGARLGYGLAAQPEVDLPFLARVCDAFTIGGTKVGFLFGEAIVLTDEGINDCFRYHIKQRGGMLAKGRLLGVQFEAMLENGDYTRLAARANDLAQELKRAFVDHGCALFSDTACLLYTSPSPRDRQKSRMPSSA